MSLYLLFLVVAALTVLSPGPGVVMTLSNALRFGLRGAWGGILGLACGAGVVAALSASSLGLLLASLALAFTVAKWIGALYLIHCAYALGAQGARRWLASERGGRLVNRGGALTFMGFGAALALARR